MKKLIIFVFLVLLLVSKTYAQKSATKVEQLFTEMIIFGNPVELDSKDPEVKDFLRKLTNDNISFIEKIKKEAFLRWGKVINGKVMSQNTITFSEGLGFNNYSIFKVCEINLTPVSENYPYTIKYIKMMNMYGQPEEKAKTIGQIPWKPIKNSWINTGIMDSQGRIVVKQENNLFVSEYEFLEWWDVAVSLMNAGCYVPHMLSQKLAHNMKAHQNMMFVYNGRYNVNNSYRAGSLEYDFKQDSEALYYSNLSYHAYQLKKSESDTFEKIWTKKDPLSKNIYHHIWENIGINVNSKFIILVNNNNNNINVTLTNIFGEKIVSVIRANTSVVIGEIETIKKNEEKDEYFTFTITTADGKTEEFTYKRNFIIPK